MKEDKYFIKGTLGDRIKGKKILDAFSGCGRLYEAYNKYDPSEIVMVDLNQKAINHVKENYKNVKAYCNDMLSWCK